MANLTDHQLQVITISQIQVKSIGGGIVAQPNGNLLVSRGSAIFSISPGFQVNVYAGDGQGVRGDKNGTRKEATFQDLRQLQVSPDGVIYVCDADNHKIRKIDDDEVTTYAGTGFRGRKDGPRTDSMFAFPTHLLLYQGCLYISEYNSMSIRIIDIASNIVSSIGNAAPNAVDGTFSQCSFSSPTGLSLGPERTVIVCEHGSHRVRSIQVEDKTVKTLAGSTKGFKDGPALQACFDLPSGSVYDKISGSIFICDSKNNRIRLFSPQGIVSTFVGSTKGSEDGNLSIATTYIPIAACLSPRGDLVWLEENGSVRSIPAISTPCIGADLSQLRSGHLSDLHIQHKPSNSALDLHSGILQAQGIEFKKLKETLSDAPFPLEIVQNFLDFVYGAPVLFSSRDPLRSLSNLLQMIQLARITGINHLETALQAELEILVAQRGKDVPLLVNLLIDIVKHCKSNQDLIAMICQRLRSMQTEIKANKDLLNPIAQLNPDLFSKLFFLIHEQDGPPLYSLPHVENAKLPAVALQTVIQALGRQLKWTQVTSSHAPLTLSSTRSNFILSIDGQSEVELRVHDWVLWRWPYFRRLISSGLEESRQSKASLPSSMPPAFLLSLLKFLYSGGSMDDIQMTEDECRFTMTHGGEFGIVGIMDHDPLPGFQAWVAYCRPRAMGILNSSNCLTLLKRRLTIGSQPEIDEAVEFVAQEIPRMTSTPALATLITALPPEIKERLLLLQLKHS
jgi:hypothetical protein